MAASATISLGISLCTPYLVAMVPKGRQSPCAKLLRPHIQRHLRHHLRHHLQHQIRRHRLRQNRHRPRLRHPLKLPRQSQPSVSHPVHHPLGDHPKSATQTGVFRRGNESVLAQMVNRIMASKMGLRWPPASGSPMEGAISSSVIDPTCGGV